MQVHEALCERREKESLLAVAVAGCTCVCAVCEWSGACSAVRSGRGWGGGGLCDCSGSLMQGYMATFTLQLICSGYVHVCSCARQWLLAFFKVVAWSGWWFCGSFLLATVPDQTQLMDGYG